MFPHLGQNLSPPWSKFIPTQVKMFPHLGQNLSPLRSKYVPTQVSPEATARPVSTEGSQARLVSQAWNSEEGQVGFLIYICICICVLLYLYLCNCICICGIVFVFDRLCLKFGTVRRILNKRFWSS